MNSPVDLNKPVTNPMVKEAIVLFGQNRCPETEKRLVEELIKANYLVPIITDEMVTKPGPEPGKTEIQAGSSIKILQCRNSQSEIMLPLFTDWEEVRLWTNQNVSVIVMPANQVWDFVLSNKEMKGIIINPAGNGWEMHVQNILEIKKLQGNS